MSEHRCLRDGEISALRENVTTLFKNQEYGNKRIDKFEAKQEAIYDIAQSIALVAENMKHMGEDMREVKLDLNTVKQDMSSLKEKVQENETQTALEKYKESRRELSVWEKYKYHFFSAIVGGIAVYLLAQVLPK